ncbi:Uncharacterised protein [BD1-7 clade bacterium]|uniref:Transglutaminase-like domain-containing protein n=1 Tax=BD1-7 clade bacterium TaxID=2029982 RepID=A0A5S9QFA4_9GAMM|nr:Uncharacterised protein [BD1-7 clade bacterium]
MSIMRAAQAVDYVANTICIQSSNRKEGINRTTEDFEDVDALIARARLLYHQLVEKYNVNQIAYRPEVVRAAISQKMGVGNCAEQAAIAFEYLKGKGEKNIAIVSIADYDHHFVVMQLIQEPAKISFFQIDGFLPPSWGVNAIVCDPWYHEWFYVEKDWHRKIKHILKRTSIRTAPEGSWCKLRCMAYVGD